LHWPWKNSKGRFASGAEFERVASVGSSGIDRQPIGLLIGYAATILIESCSNPGVASRSRDEMIE
jgi:hypothetical protein